MIQLILSLIISQILFTKILLCDAPKDWQMYFQDPATPIAEGMLFFHNYIMFFLITIGVCVSWMLYTSYIINKTETRSKFSGHALLEIYWTLIPAGILVFIAFPSFSLLYSLEETVQPELTVKIIGHQWYWSYELNDETFDLYTLTTFQIKGLNLAYDSYLQEPQFNLKRSFRLLQVDRPLILPVKTHIRFLITSADVLHSWAVPSFGIKIDAVPGRLSQCFVFIKRMGDFFGQCSEICGVNHGFMPIHVKVYDISTYDWYLFLASKYPTIFRGGTLDQIIESYTWYNTPYTEEEMPSR